MSTLTDMVDSYLTPNLKEGETINLSLFTPRQRTNIRLYGLEFKDFTAMDIARYKEEWMKDCEKVDLTNRGNRVWARKFCRKNFNHQNFHMEFQKNDIIFFKNPQDAMVFKLAYKG